jgi:exopolyphosphatase / guanosine-5'-triphosphate,3'-diphosphate pyrophosphatase
MNHCVPTDTSCSDPRIPRRAVIDIGTNSVKLLVADLAADVEPVLETSRQTRLGQGFYETHRLQPQPILDTARTVGEFAQRARALGAESIRIIATSAARDAVNGHDLVSAVEAAAGAPVEIISGEQEADWTFAGVASHPLFANAAVLILDIGGGSTEFILGENRIPVFRHSFKLGTVRLLEKLPLPDPPTSESLAHNRDWTRNFLDREVGPVLEPALVGLDGKPVLVGTGGTASILARVHLATHDFDRQAIENVRLTHGQISAIVERLWSLPLAERSSVPGIPPERADVILPGLAILEGAMARFGIREFRASTRGLRFAALWPR